MKFGENLKSLRKNNNLSQEQLAEKVRVSRQSVSKWETGEAYPEMNNILELCKIFKCNINDLVNDSIIDLDSLDEEIKMSVVKFKKEKQNKVKTLSKIIEILSKIGQVIIWISSARCITQMQNSGSGCVSCRRVMPVLSVSRRKFSGTNPMPSPCRTVGKI